MKRLYAFLVLVIGASFLASSGPIQWMDNGALLADAAAGDYFSTSLGPLDHPFYQLLATAIRQLFGAEVFSYVNALLLIPLAMLIVSICQCLNAGTRVGLLAAITAILSHGIFWVSTKAEIYLLHTVLVLAVFRLYLGCDGRHSRSALLLIGVLTGLAATVHQLTFIVLLPVYVSILLRNRSGALWAVPGFLLGFMPAYPALLNDLQQGRDLLAIARTFLTGTVPDDNLPGWESSLFRFDLILQEQVAVVVLLLSLLGPQLLGLVVPQREGKLRVLWLAVALNFAFAVSYNVLDRFTFFIPGLALASILGCVVLSEKLSATVAGTLLLNASTLCTPLVLLMVYAMYSVGAVHLPRHSVTLPFRDDARYFLVPYLRDRSAEELIDHYERVIPEGAVVLADWTPMGALRSAQAYGRLPGRSLLLCDSSSGAIEEHLKTARVFLVRTDYCGGVADRFRLRAITGGYEVAVKPPDEQ